jgi:hypothetical protein
MNSPTARDHFVGDGSSLVDPKRDLSRRQFLTRDAAEVGGSNQSAHYRPREAPGAVLRWHRAGYD